MRNRCIRDDNGRVHPCDKRASAGPSEYAYSNVVRCAWCDVFLRPVTPVKGIK